MMKPIDVPENPHDKSPVKDILKRHGASLYIKGARGSSHKAIAEELIAELESEKYRSQVVQNNLNAILNQYQVTAQSLKALQAEREELMRKYNQKLLELKAETNGNSDETETEGA
jgi:Cdc6-like AAA superfamily ATPase